METLIQRILNILIAPPGNLIYHLVLAFSILSSLQAAIISRRVNKSILGKRLMMGLVMLLTGQLLLFLSSGLAWQGLLNPHIFLPPLDRAIFTFSLLWVVWLWCFPQPARLADLVTGFLNLAILVLFLFTYASWSTQGTELSFNNSWTDWVWELAALFIVLTGMVILMLSRPTGWSIGFSMLALCLAGIVAHILLTPNTGDFSGFLRLSLLAAFPLLPNLLQRAFAPTPVEIIMPAPSRKIEPVKSVPRATNAPERRRYSSDVRTVHAFLELKEMRDPEKTGFALSKAIAHTLFADLCFIVTGPVNGAVIMQAGYDLIREEEMPGTILDRKQVPALVNALQQGKGLRITSSDPQPPDINTISDVLSLKSACTLMLLPLQIESKPWGGILLLSPYSNRQWSPEDQAYLASETTKIAEILQKAQSQQQALIEHSQITEDVQYLREEISKLKVSNQDLAGNLDETQRQLEAARAALEETRQSQEVSQQKAPVEPLSADLEGLIALQKEAQDFISVLQAENEQLKEALSERPSAGISITDANRLEEDLRSTLKEIAHLQNLLAKANAQILMYERQPALSQTGEMEPGQAHEVLVSITQDLRQPLASIIGYTDLLLSESVGILGMLQRKFLERTRASAERMHSMVNDLIQVTTTGKGPATPLIQPIDLGSVIDSAMIDTSAQLREKNITLRVDLPHEMPGINADRDALQQIVVHLLQNAGTVTPQEGIITLRARIQEEKNEPYLLLQVIDTGGGIQPENLSRVFSQRYRADAPLIQGLGDTGVGLSIAKTLVEASHGRIWVESDAGQTTFSILLPLHSHSEQTSIV